MCRNPPILLPQQINILPNSIRYRGSLRRRRSYQHILLCGYHYLWSIYRNCRLHRNCFLPSLDWKEDEGFRCIQSTATIKPSTYKCFAIGIPGTVHGYGAEFAENSEGYDHSIGFERSCCRKFGKLGNKTQERERKMLMERQNLSQFLIIGRMSALTFNVASNVKTIIILTYGWVSEGRVLTLTDASGIILALGGATLYSQLSQR